MKRKLAIIALALAIALTVAVGAAAATDNYSEDFEEYNVGDSSPGTWNDGEIVDDSLHGTRSLEVMGSNIETHTSISMESNNFDMEYSTRPANLGGDYNRWSRLGVMNDGRDGDYVSFAISQTDNEARIQYGIGGTSDSESMHIDIENEDWYHIEFWSDGEQIHGKICDEDRVECETASLEYPEGDFTGTLTHTSGSTTNDIHLDDVEVAPNGQLFGDSINGTVTDQDGNPVPDATVEAWGISEGILDPDAADSLQRQAEWRLDELSDPFPAQWDPDLDLEDYAEESDTEYVLAHTDEDWGISWTIALFSNVDPPRLHFDTDDHITFSIWDPEEEGGWVDNQADQSFPGATTGGTIIVHQLGPTGEAIETQEFETEKIAETGISSIRWSKDHEGYITRMPPGVYRAYPEGSPGGGYTFVVGDKDQLANQFEAQLRDEANALTERSQEIQGLLDEDGLVRETAQTNEAGEFELDMPSAVVTAQIHAMKADGTVLEGISNPSMADLRDAQQDGYDGSFYLPSPQAQKVSPPEEDVEVNVYRSPELPLSNMDTFAELKEFLDNQRMDEKIEQLRNEYDERFDELDRTRLEQIYKSHRPIVESAPGAEDRYLDRSGFEEIQDAEDLTDAELETETGHMQSAMTGVDTIEPPDLDDPIRIDDGELFAEIPIPSGVNSDTLSPEIHWSDGSSDEIGENYWSVQSGGFLSGDELAIDGYPIGEDDPALFDLRILGGGSDGIYDDRIPGSNPAWTGNAPDVRSIDINTLSPGSAERVSLSFRTSEGNRFQDVDSATVFSEGNQTEVDATIEDGRVRFDTDGDGTHIVRATLLDDSGSKHVHSFTLNALEQPRSDPPTVQAERSVGDQLVALAGEGLRDAEISQDREDISVTAITRAGETPGSVHVKPGSVMDHSSSTIDVTVLDGPEERQLRTAVELVLHLENVDPDDTIVWRDEPGTLAALTGQPLNWDGGTRWGEVVDRNVEESGDKVVIRTFTDETGHGTVSVDQDPGRISSLQHWLALNLPRPSIPFGVGAVVPLVATGLFVGRRKLT